MMTAPIQKLDRLYVATPCSADWESMHGNDKVRFCQHCNLNVYNISMMTKAQAESLIASSEGRLCTKFYRRIDGTILTKDCPVGLRALRRRVSRVASAAFGVVLSLCTSASIRISVYGSESQGRDTKVKIKRTKIPSQDSRSALSGTVLDINQAVIANAKINLLNERTNETKTINSSEEGKFQFASLENGSYTLVVESPGFVTFRKKNLEIESDESLELEITLQVGSVGGAAFLPDKHSSNAQVV
jgi:hypothetical protein